MPRLQLGAPPAPREVTYVGPSDWSCPERLHARATLARVLGAREPVAPAGVAVSAANSASAASGALTDRSSSLTAPAAIGRRTSADGSHARAANAPGVLQCEATQRLP